MKKAFTLIFAISILMVGCSHAAPVDTKTDGYVQLSPSPSFSVEQSTQAVGEDEQSTVTITPECTTTAENITSPVESDSNSHIESTPIPQATTPTQLPEVSPTPSILPDEIPMIDSEAREDDSETEAAPEIETGVDSASIEAYAEAYAASIGFVVDNSLGTGNAGYYPPDCRPLSSTQEGCNIASGMVAATRNQLNSRFSSEPCDTLVEEAYGLARINCQVVFSHSDETGSWYYIYVFYG